MTLLSRVLNAHGGIENWNSLTTVSARVTVQGQTSPRKKPTPTHLPFNFTAWLHQERAIATPYEDSNAPVSDGLDLANPLLYDDRLFGSHRAFATGFAGREMRGMSERCLNHQVDLCALWTYFTIPFLFLMPGVVVKEILPWKTGNEVWRGLRAKLPPYMATRNTVQECYFGEDFLLRRHDYTLQEYGGDTSAQYVSDFAGISGLSVARMRRSYLRSDMLRPDFRRLLVSITLSDVIYS